MRKLYLVLTTRPRGTDPAPARRRRGRFGITVAMVALVAAVASAVDAGAASSLPAIGTPPTDVALRAVPGAVPYNGGYAIPLKAARPAWYTDAMSSRAHNSPGTPQPAPTDAPLPGVVGIRPGSWMIEPYGCTMNFVFARGSQLGIGTAGHCTDMLRQDVVLLTLTPGSNNPILIDIGKVVARDDNGVGDDFALVDIYPQLYSWVSATAAAIGGPCGAYYGSGPEVVWHYGQGLGIGAGGTPRSGPSLTWEQNAFGWDSAAIFGDSGSPVRVTAGLQAAGDLTHLVVDANWLPSLIAGTRIGKILQIASGWQLVSSPLCL